jgi:hypothetical protein
VAEIGHAGTKAYNILTTISHGKDLLGDLDVDGTQS